MRIPPPRILPHDFGECAMIPSELFLIILWKTKQNKTKQNKQNKTKQNTTNQNRQNKTKKKKKKKKRRLTYIGLLLVHQLKFIKFICNALKYHHFGLSSMVLARLRSFISSVILPSSLRGDCGADRSGDPLSNLGLLWSMLSDLFKLIDDRQF